MTSMTVLMAAQATGPPPNVVPSAPALRSVAMVCGISTAPHGKPPPKPFATVKRSGRTPWSCAPNGAPSRPMPVCTSSMISSAPARSQAARIACRNSGAKSNAPAKPCTGSMMTAAVLESTAAASAAASLRGTNATSNGVRGKPYHVFAAP